MSGGLEDERIGPGVMRDAGHHAIECRAVLGSVKARRLRAARSEAAALTDPSGSPCLGICVMAGGRLRSHSVAGGCSGDRSRRVV
jgi:hypothetical protein